MQNLQQFWTKLIWSYACPFPTPKLGDDDYYDDTDDNDDTYQQDLMSL